eukprot:gene9258-12473_t
MEPIRNKIAEDYPNAINELEKCMKFIRENNKYLEELQAIANRQSKLLQIEMDDIQDFVQDDEFVRSVQTNTIRYVRYFEEVVQSIMPAPNVVLPDHGDVFDVLQSQRTLARLRAVQVEDDADLMQTAHNAEEIAAENVISRYEIVILPLSSSKPRKLREIKAQEIGSLVKIKGMVTRASDVKPQISVCTYTCEICNCEIFQQVIGSQFMPYTACISDFCKDNKSIGKLVQQTRGSKFIKYQELRIQELPDQVPVGHIPRAMTVHCKGEQTRKCGPGDLITISGVFLPVQLSGYRAIMNGLSADTYIEAYSIEKEKLNYRELGMDDAAARLIQEIGMDSDPYTRLANSIAPEIYGHEDVKKALLLQLVGGVTRELPDGMKIRGDINICLMGDPGVAKSQLLKYIATIAPRGVYTTGKGSSGVGLTAAVVRDTLSGDLTLEGGALVLADMGICCIDEFDKMDEKDRTAIHEVMEQQTISIAKAGITTTLNARAAVLAAANPLYGRYNLNKTISENVALPNSLLSRFDLLFLILDKPDVDKDSSLARHVLHVHKHLKNRDHAITPLTPEAFKQYISVARAVNPTVPKELSVYIVEAYVDLRQQDSEGGRKYKRAKYQNNNSNQAVMTARQLLSILRLSQALARLRLSNTVAHADVDEAIRLTYSSKASLNEDSSSLNNNNIEDVQSMIYGIIRDFSLQRNVKVLNYANIEAMVLKKGYTSAQLKSCIDEYNSLGIISIDKETSTIHME